VRPLIDGAKPPEGAPEFQDQVGSVLQRLSTAISAVIEAIPSRERISRAIDLQRALGIRATLAWKVFKLGSSPDLVTEVPAIPGAGALKSFFKAAASHGVPVPILESAATEVDLFQAFVKAHAGDRTTFGSMISGLKNNDSGPIDFQHRRAAFKAQSHIWGVQARTQLGCAILQASTEDPTRGDAVGLRGFIDLKRLRPDVRVTFVRSGAYDNDGQVRHTFSRQPIDPDGFSEHGIPLLTEFSTYPAPRFASIPGVNGEVSLVMEGDRVGNRSRVTCLTGDVFRGGLSRYRDEHNSCGSVRLGVRVPCEVLIHDTLVHEDMYAGRVSPSVHVYSTAGGGTQGLPREVDRLPMRETVMYLGRGSSALATPDVPRYVEMVEYAMRRLGWDGNRFLVYRCRVEFPVMPSSVVVQFELPTKPT